MAQTFRFGFQITSNDVFWVLVGTAIENSAHRLGVHLVALDIDPVEPHRDYTPLLEELQAQEINALIVWQLPQSLTELILARNIPIILLDEWGCAKQQDCHHSGLIAPFGLYEVARLMTDYLVKQLAGRGTLLAIGGLTGTGEDGRSRIAAIFDTLSEYPSMQLYHWPTPWRYSQAYPYIIEKLKQLDTAPAAIFGLSDTLALAGRDAAQQLGLLNPDTLVAGINGDPEALAAIAEGTMTATVETVVADFARQAVELAVQAASGHAVPMHFNYKARLVTTENVAEVAAQKLISIAELPNRLVGVNRYQEQQRMTQLETGLVINQQIGAILDRHKLTQAIVSLIASNYNYDRVELYWWSEENRALVRDGAVGLVSLAQVENPGGYEDSLLSVVMESGELIFVPDMRYSQRFPADPNRPHLCSRVVLPVRLGERRLGVLDLQCDRVTPHSREKLIGLQLLADQLAIAIQNAELYDQAIVARQLAEKADKLKTRLLANVSHELRTPLNIILGYTKTALDTPNSYGVKLPEELLTDLSHVYRSGEHLTRLINDLLDLSRAEIDELEIFPQIIALRPFLEEVFHSIADITAAAAPVKWQFIPPEGMPLLQADPVRLRQILLNLLSNARKFTTQGHITLGAELQPPYLHIWVQDTGIGIPLEQQTEIFEPFVAGLHSSRNLGGIGLGLNITRRLVILHRGTIQVESTPGQGSTFHLYLPLPSLTGQLTAPLPAAQRRLVCITRRSELPPEVERLSRQDNISLYRLSPAQAQAELLELQPSILVWDMVGLTQSDWQALDYLRNTPLLAQLPLVLVGETETTETAEPASGPGGLTNILLKPFNAQTVQTLLEALRPSQNQGKILIVDDDVQTLDLYQQLIATALPNLAIYRAANGREALALLTELTPDLVIIDLTMPEVDGFEVLEWLRTNPLTRSVPVLVMSGKMLSAEDIQRLDFARVVFHSKDILREEEAGRVMQQVLEGTALLPQYKSLLVKRIVVYLQQSYAQPLSMQALSQHLGISKNYLGELFRQELGISPWEYLNRYRVKQAKALLETTALNITEVAAQVGFEDPAYFSRVFRTHIGQSPKEYRQRALHD